MPWWKLSLGLWFYRGKVTKCRQRAHVILVTASVRVLPSNFQAEVQVPLPTEFPSPTIYVLKKEKKDFEFLGLKTEMMTQDSGL